MKQIKFTLAVILMLSMSGMAISQDYVFRVLAKKGENSMSTDGKNWSPIKTGTSLKAGQQIKVGEGSYLGLVHKTGKTFEIKTAGISKVNELASKVDVADASVATKYADFVMNKMNASDEDINKNHRNYLSATGAVTRGANSAIKMLMPKTSDIYNDNTAVEWTELEDDTKTNPIYVLTVRNMFDEVLLTEETSKLGYELDLNQDNFKSEQMVIMHVSIKGENDLKSDTYAIKRIDKDVAKPMLSELEEIKALTSEETAMNKLILASFYEQNNLMMDAMTNYRAAMNLAPDVAIFRHAFEQFVVTNALGTK